MTVLLLGGAAASLGAQAAVTIDPGMTREQVVAKLGDPLSVRAYEGHTYLYYKNGCEKTCGMNDLVVLDSGKVVDAIFRATGRQYSGASSSPRMISQAEARKGNGGAPLAIPAGEPAKPTVKAPPKAPSAAPAKSPSAAPKSAAPAPTKAGIAPAKPQPAPSNAKAAAPPPAASKKLEAAPSKTAAPPPAPKKAETVPAPKAGVAPVKKDTATPPKKPDPKKPPTDIEG
jgi:hypothetical protein